MSKQDWFEYVSLCGWVLARAHARTGDPAWIAGYLGRADVFDEAIAKFAVAYADQTERDYAAFLKAIRAGRIRARSGAEA
jgi:NAD(P)H-dependent flavin oxidoreductase YrpB (nitropropane dioxygenase family)